METYEIQQFQEALVKIIRDGQLTLTRQAYGHSWRVLAGDLRQVLKNSGYSFIEDIPNPGEWIFVLAPKYRAKVSINNGRKSKGKNISDVLANNVFKPLESQDITCNEVFQYKKISGITEPVIVRLLAYYCGITSPEGRDNLQLLWTPRYWGEAGNEQEIDISIEENGIIKAGISIKSRFGGGSLQEPDLRLSVFNEPLIKDHLNKFEIGASVNDVIQDVARIENIKRNGMPFESVTILFSCPHQFKKVNMCNQAYHHSYLFLENNQSPFFNSLEISLPVIKSWKRIS